MRTNRLLFGLAFLGMIVIGPKLFADLIPPGFKAVQHELIFVESEELARSRLVAAPVRGLGGVTTIVPGTPFRFSSKYGTKLYLVPADAGLLEDFDREKFSQWPSLELPVQEVKSLPITSPIAFVVTQLRLADLSPSGLVVQVVDHQEMIEKGVPVPPYYWLWKMAIPSGIGLTILSFLAWRRWSSVSNRKASELKAS